MEFLFLNFVFDFFFPFNSALPVIQAPCKRFGLMPGLELNQLACVRFCLTEEFFVFLRCAEQQACAGGHRLTGSPAHTLTRSLQTHMQADAGPAHGPNSRVLQLSTHGPLFLRIRSAQHTHQKHKCAMARGGPGEKELRSTQVGGQENVKP